MVIKYIERQTKYNWVFFVPKYILLLSYSAYLFLQSFQMEQQFHVYLASIRICEKMGINMPIWKDKRLFVQHD